MNFSSDSNLGHHPPSSLVTPSNIMKLEPVDYSEMTDNGVAVIPNVWSSSPTSVIADRVPHHTNQGYQTAYSQPVLPLHTPYVTQSRPNSSDFTDSEDEEIDVPAGQQNTYETPHTISDILRRRHFNETTLTHSRLASDQQSDVIVRGRSIANGYEERRFVVGSVTSESDPRHVNDCCRTMDLDCLPRLDVVSRYSDSISSGRPYTI